jgi:RNA polymerase sigma-70 factor (ECF subfamily)
LLASLSHFLSNEWQKRRTQKRGGRCEIISWDEARAEERYGREPADPTVPERLFERRWAFTLIEEVLTRLRQEYETKGKLSLFEKLQGCLTTEATPGFCSVAAGELNMSEGAAKVALHRLRRRFGELLRSQITQTVESPEQVEEEIRHLFAALSS